MTNLDPDPNKNPKRVFWRKGPPEETSTSRTHLALSQSRSLCRVAIPKKSVWDSEGGGRVCAHCQDKWVKMWYFNYTEQQYDTFQPLFCQMGGGLPSLQLTTREKYSFPQLAKELGESHEAKTD